MTSGVALSASSARTTTWRSTWLVSNTSPHTTTNSHPSATASAPMAPTALSRAAVNRACASAPRKWRVMPSCQSALWRNLVTLRTVPRGRDSHGDPRHRERGPERAHTRRQSRFGKVDQGLEQRPEVAFYPSWTRVGRASGEVTTSRPSRSR